MTETWLVLNNEEEIDEQHEKWWGGEDLTIVETELRALFENKILFHSDGEYSHSVKLDIEDELKQELFKTIDRYRRKKEFEN